MLKKISMDRVIPNANQPRKRFDAEPLHELASSIRKNGLMQPITVRPIDGGKFQIVAGERRFRAHRLIGAKEIECNVQQLDDQAVAVQAVIENLQRVDVTPLEEATALERLLAFLDERELAERLGIPEYRLARKLSILRLEGQVRQLVDRGFIPIGSAYEIAKLPPAGQVKLVQQITRTGTGTTNYDEVRAGVQAMLDKLAQDEFFDLPKPTEKELATVKQMEQQIDAIVRLVNAGWKDGECVIAKKVAPDRVRLMAEKCAALKTCLDRMERQLRRAATQGEIALS